MRITKRQLRRIIKEERKAMIAREYPDRHRRRIAEDVSDDRSEELMEAANKEVEAILKSLWHDLYDEGFTGEGMGDAKLEELLERLMGNVKAGFIGEPR